MDELRRGQEIRIVETEESPVRLRGATGEVISPSDDHGWAIVALNLRSGQVEQILVHVSECELNTGRNIPVPPVELSTEPGNSSPEVTGPNQLWEETMDETQTDNPVMKIRLKQAIITGRKDTIKAEVVTHVTITAPFDRMIAKMIGAEDALFDRIGLREGPKQWQLDYEKFGCNVVLGAIQLSLTGQEEGLEIRALRLDKFVVQRDKTHGTTSVKFTMAFVETNDLELTKFIKGTGNQEIAVTIEMPEEEDEAAARRDAENLNLFKAPKEDGDAPADSDDSSDSDDQEAEATPEPEEEFV